jgi:thymidine phosphorylase
LDYSTGIEWLVRIGDKISAGQPIAKLFCPRDRAAYPKELISSSIGVSPTPVEPLPLIVEAL